MAIPDLSSPILNSRSPIVSFRGAGGDEESCLRIRFLTLFGMTDRTTCRSPLHPARPRKTTEKANVHEHLYSL
jgi:hypothetical protein